MSEVPGSAAWVEELGKRRRAAEAWLRQNIRLALVVPRDVARDIFPEGYGQSEWQKEIEELLPGRRVESVEVSANLCFAILEA